MTIREAVDWIRIRKAIQRVVGGQFGVTDGSRRLNGIEHLGDVLFTEAHCDRARTDMHTARKDPASACDAFLIQTAIKMEEQYGCPPLPESVIIAYFLKTEYEHEFSMMEKVIAMMEREK